MGGWMDLITIYVSPFGALLVAVCIYFVLGMKDIRAELALGRARAGLAAGLTPDAVLIDVEEAMEAMGELTGRTVREDITNRIFERFCVGK